MGALTDMATTFLVLKLGLRSRVILTHEFISHGTASANYPAFLPAISCVYHISHHFCAYPVSAHPSASHLSWNVLNHFVPSWKLPLIPNYFACESSLLVVVQLLSCVWLLPASLGIKWSKKNGHHISYNFLITVTTTTVSKTTEVLSDKNRYD